MSAGADTYPPMPMTARTLFFRMIFRADSMAPANTSGKKRSFTGFFANDGARYRSMSSAATSASEEKRSSRLPDRKMRPHAGCTELLVQGDARADVPARPAGHDENAYIAFRIHCNTSSNNFISWWAAPRYREMFRRIPAAIMFARSDEPP